MRTIDRTTSRGLQRLVESYTPLGESWTDVYAQFGDIVDAYAGTKPNWEEDVRREVKELYLSHKGEPDWDKAWAKWIEPALDEALSDEAKSNNEMIDKILSKSPSKLTKAEKEFLTKNGLTRHNDNYDPAIQKGNAILYKGQDSGIAKSYKNKDKVDKLDYLNKRDERSRYSEEDPLRANRARRNNFKSQKQQANRFRDAAMKSPDNFDYLNKYADQWDKRADANYAFHSNKFAESLEEDDYFDFVHDLSTAVKQCTKKWQSRGISASDVANALDELSVRFEDLGDFDEE